eukprot:551647-Amphidinium_carterae.1
MFVASAEYVSKHLCESCPTDATVVAFMEEIPGCLPLSSALFVDEYIPSAAESGTWLYLDDQGGVRLRENGSTVDEVYVSAAEAEDPETALSLS